ARRGRWELCVARSMPIVLTAVDGANFCDMGRAPCFSIPRKILCRAGREHGRAIPLADIRTAAKNTIRSPRRRGRAASVARQGPAPLYDALSGWAGTEK